MLSTSRLIKTLLPTVVKKKLHNIMDMILKRIDCPVKYLQPRRNKAALEKLSVKIANNESIKIVFFVVDSSIWKYDEIYRLMSMDDRFDPVVIVCPAVNYDKQNMISKMQSGYSYFRDKGYNVVRAYNEQNDCYLDVRKDISPDIIFYTIPYQGFIDKRYYITNFEDILSCYVRYFFQSISTDHYNRDFIFHNRIWKFFCETEYHMKKALDRYSNDANKYVHTGYPGVEGLVYNHSMNNDELKNEVKNPKRIIWAPHHTIDKRQITHLSTFLDYYQFMVNIANRYSEEIIFVFKPHPVLKVKLYQHPEWGKTRTDEYFELWDNMPNTMFQDAGYIDTFNHSDAMIFDCNSFISEYLYTGKPALFLLAHDDVKSLFNAFGKNAIKQHYHGNTEVDIINFIENVVLDENDYNKKKRHKFYMDNLIPPNDKSASENIIDEILRAIYLDSER